MTYVYSIIAGIGNFYFLSMLLGGLAALGVSLTQKPIPMFLDPALVFLSLVLSVIYQVFIARRLLWLTPGEQLMGRTLQGRAKVWNNPYGINRGAIFLTILFTLVMAGNLWDRLSEGYIYSFTEVAIRALILLLLSYGLVSIGQGNLRGFLYPIAFYLFLAGQTLNSRAPGSERNALNSFAFFLAGVAVFHVLVALVYYLLQCVKARQSS